jgi:endonuclease/exonuclease/phosphatase (EEP) superfamily protein YafD
MGRIFNFTFLLASIGLILVSLAGYWGKLHLYLELAAHFKWQYLILSLCPFFFFLLQFCFKSRQKLEKLGLILSGFCLVINLGEILPWYFPHHWFNQDIQGQELRVLLSNMDKYKDNSDRAIALIQKERPDIIETGFLPAFWLGDRGLSAETRFLDGTLILSHIPLENPQIKSLGGGRKSLLANLQISGQLISLIAVHPSKATGQIYFEERNRQLEAIADYAATLKNPVILIGDMNVTMWSPYYRDLIKKTQFQNVRAGFGILPTWPTFQPLLYIPIDHCLVSPDFQVLKVRRGPAIGSDHFPLITDLTLASIE